MVRFALPEQLLIIFYLRGKGSVYMVSLAIGHTYRMNVSHRPTDSHSLFVWRQNLEKREKNGLALSSKELGAWQGELGASRTNHLKTNCIL